MFISYGQRGTYWVADSGLGTGWSGTGRRAGASLGYSSGTASKSTTTDTRSPMTDTFFEDAIASGGPARQRGLPMLTPRGAPKGVRAAYTRASSFADRIQNKDFLWTWKMRYLARGIAENEDLALLLAGEIYTTGFSQGDIGENRASGKRIDIVIERALDRMGIAEKADYGTAVHSFCVPDANEPTERVRADVDAYYACLEAHGLTVIESEVFIANDEVMAAGTFDDLLYSDEYGYVGGDKKTGKMGAGFAVQLGIYFNGERYDTDTDTRSPIVDNHNGAFVSDAINKDVALLFAIKDGECEMYEVDIAKGWRIAQQIADIYSDFDMGLFTKVKAPMGAAIGTMIQQCKSTEEMEALWRRTKDRWDTFDAKLAKKRRAELEKS